MRAVRRGFEQPNSFSRSDLGVALRAGELRAPLSLGPAVAGLLRTLRIPNAGIPRVPDGGPLAGSL